MPDTVQIGQIYSSLKVIKKSFKTNDGIVSIDGLHVFVPDCEIDDIVSVRITRLRSKSAEGVKV